ncbi:MAG: mannonate dehydratase [Pedobacter sp.]|nr:MAG: mannonate dehydratase [Pedobacter sp.]
MKMIQTMRWYGPDDVVTLSDIRQAGCEGVVSALHHIPVGMLWSTDEIQKRKLLIESAGMEWKVVESLPVHEDIKKASGNFQNYIENYKNSLKNLKQAGIETVTYNFMPVLDWMRTDLSYLLEGGALALRFEKAAFTAFDVFLLKRPEALNDYNEQELERARDLFGRLDESGRKELTESCLQGLPGSRDHFSAELVLNLLEGYRGIDADVLRKNLISFLNEVCPLAQQLGINLAIHPDDPPYPILGLPRVVSTEDDLKYILESVPIKSNGLCFCSGSLGVRPENDLKGIINRYGDRIYFLHLRSVQREAHNNFHEAGHLEGCADMYELVKALVILMQRSKRRIPMRPDHGHQILDDLHKKTYPGYSAIGRLKGLAEIRGLEMGISGMLNQK